MNYDVKELASEHALGAPVPPVGASLPWGSCTHYVIAVILVRLLIVVGVV